MSSLLDPSRKVGRGAAALLVGLALVVPAQARASGDEVWGECINNGTVSSNHTQKEFQAALTNPPADGAEYTDCLSLISAAQKKAAVGGSGSSSGGGSSGGAGGSTGSSSGGGTGGAGTAAPSTSSSGATGGSADRAVDPAELQKALTKSGVDTTAPATGVTAAPAPSMVGGQSIDLGSERMPSLANTLSLPLPLAASAVVVMLSAALPAVRFAVGRFGAPPTGTSPAP